MLVVRLDGRLVVLVCVIDCKLFVRHSLVREWSENA